MKCLTPLTTVRIANAGTELNAIPRICVRIYRQVAMAVVLAVTLAVPATMAQTEKQTQKVYTVAGVAVDNTAETAATAREQAIVEGHRLAFDRLIARLVPADQRGNIDRPTQSDIVPLVLSYEIEEEKRSSVRYLGMLKFRFRRGEVRAFLQSKGINFAETRSKRVLVLPVYEYAGALLLWDDPNPWLVAWNEVPPSDGLMPLRLPVGDLADIRDISAEQAAAGNAGQLALVAERYGASAVLVAKASVNVEPGTNKRSLGVTTRYFGGTSADRTAVRSFDYSDEDTDETVIRRAAQQIAVQVEDDWKQENLLRFDRLNSLVADISLTELRQWVEMRERLRQIAYLQRWQLVSVTRRNASVRLTYYGDAEQLRVALAQRDIVLEQGAVNWSLRESRDARSAPAPQRADEEVPR